MLPGVMGVIKYVGAAYILWLAVHIALSRPDLDQGEQSASFWKGFVLQFVNVKIYMFGITPWTGYISALYFGPARPAVFRGDVSHHRTVATGTWIAAGMLTSGSIGPLQAG